MSKKPDRVFVVMRHIDCECDGIVEVFASKIAAHAVSELLNKVESTPLIRYAVSEHAITEATP